MFLSLFLPPVPKLQRKKPLPLEISSRDSVKLVHVGTGQKKNRLKRIEVFKVKKSSSTARSKPNAYLGTKPVSNLGKVRRSAGQCWFAATEEHWNSHILSAC